MAAVNQKHINILRKLIKKGLTTKKDILSLDLYKVLKMNLTRSEMTMACELMDSIKSNDLLGFFVDETATESEEEDET